MLAAGTTVVVPLPAEAADPAIGITAQLASSILPLPAVGATASIASPGGVADTLSACVCSAGEVTTEVGVGLRQGQVQPCVSEEVAA